MTELDCSVTAFAKIHFRDSVMSNLVIEIKINVISDI
jgi:hypothetical protein